MDSVEALKITQYIDKIIKKSVKNCYLIDYENVKETGFNGIEKIGEDSAIIIFYSKNALKLSIDTLNFVGTGKVMSIKVTVGERNALDFQLVSMLGYLISRFDKLGNTVNYFVVTGDVGFESACRFWSKEGYIVNRVKDIDTGTKIVINYEGQQKLVDTGDSEIDVVAENESIELKDSKTKSTNYKQKSKNKKHKTKIKSRKSESCKPKSNNLCYTDENADVITKNDIQQTISYERVSKKSKKKVKSCKKKSKSKKKLDKKGKAKKSDSSSQSIVDKVGVANGVSAVTTIENSQDNVNNIENSGLVSLLNTELDKQSEKLDTKTDTEFESMVSAIVLTTCQNFINSEDFATKIADIKLNDIYKELGFNKDDILFIFRVKAENTLYDSFGDKSIEICNIKKSCKNKASFYKSFIKLYGILPTDKRFNLVVDYYNNIKLYLPY